MKKTRFKSWEEVESNLLKNNEFKLLYDQRRFFLEIAHLISELRAKKGISQIELAKNAKVSQPFIARIENGDPRRTPTLETIHKILHALGYSLEISAKPEKRRAA